MEKGLILCTCCGCPAQDDEPVDGPRVLTEGDMGEPASEATTPMLTASPQPPHYDGIPAPDVSNTGALLCTLVL